MGRVLSLKEAAQIVGVHINTMRIWAQRKTVPAKKIGGCWRIREKDLEGLFLS